MKKGREKPSKMMIPVRAKKSLMRFGVGRICFHIRKSAYVSDTIWDMSHSIFDIKPYSLPFKELNFSLEPPRFFQKLLEPSINLPFTELNFFLKSIPVHLRTPGNIINLLIIACSVLMFKHTDVSLDADIDSLTRFVFRQVLFVQPFAQTIFFW